MIADHVPKPFKAVGAQYEPQLQRAELPPKRYAQLAIIVRSPGAPRPFRELPSARLGPIYDAKCRAWIIERGFDQHPERCPSSVVQSL